jgi:histidinol phosphatase-like PHP family hydrolase
MRQIFPRRLYFMGHLSDVAVYNQLLDTTYFAAFFRDGVRANNTSVASALEHGAVVITNLDAHSPPELRHMDNVIDIARCDELPADLLTLKRISVRAMETARERSWAALIQTLREEAPPG